MSNRLSFTCPGCGAHRLEEVALGVVTSSRVWTVHAWKDKLENTEVEYGPVDTEDGQIERFQCAACGTPLETPDGTVITESPELAKWLFDHGMLEEAPERWPAKKRLTTVVSGKENGDEK